MDIEVLTLFPEMIEAYTGRSILGRAQEKGALSVRTVNIRDFSVNRHHRVDDYPYGGGAGMVIEAEPVYRALQHAKQRIKKTEEAPRIVYLTPQGEVLTQNKAEQLALEESLILLCGHYEGIDERVLEECVTDYISIGDYVLTGGELGALVLIDAVARFVPGVLGNESSSDFESMQDKLLEYPHYTRPECWMGRMVPEVLLQGDHQKVEAWRLEQSLIRTKERRSDLYDAYIQPNIFYIGEVQAEASNLQAILSRYGLLYDYNRKKLQKERRILSEKERAVFLIETDAEDREQADLQERIRSAFSRLEGNKKRCIVIWLDRTEETDVPDLIQDRVEQYFNKKKLLPVFCSGSALRREDPKEIKHFVLMLRRILEEA